MSGWLHVAILGVVVAAASPLDRLLQRQAASTGALEKMRTITLRMRMVEPEASYDLLARMRRPDRYRIDLGALHPDQPSGSARRRLEAHYEDYRAVAGVVLPHRIRVVDLDTGRVAQTVLVDSVRIDEEMPDPVFERR